MVIFRFNTSRTLGGRSGCMVCQKQLVWYELFPVFSYLALLGRCKGCKTKISIQYPVVELITGLLFAFLFLKFQDVFFLDTISFSIVYAYYASIFSLLIVVATYDLKHKIIPDILSIFLAGITFLGLFFINGSGLEGQASFGFHIPSLLDFLSGFFISVPFALMWLISRGKWMGLGDAKLAVGLGWLLGISNLFSGVVLSFWTGALVGIILMIFSKKHSIKSEIPFAPFLVLGTILAFFLQLQLFAISF